MYNEFDKHKKSDSVKWWIVFIAIILLAASVLGIATKGFTQAGPFGWFSQTESENEPEKTPDTPTEGNQNLLCTVESTPMMYLSAKRAAAPTSSYVDDVPYELYASVQPANADPGVYMWSVEWEDPNSAFAMGEDVYDYFDLHDGGDGLAYIRALRAFGEPIIVTVQSSINPNAKATCKIDYGRKTLDHQTLEVESGLFFMEPIMNQDERYGVQQIQPMSADDLYDAYFLSGSLVFSQNMSSIYTVDQEDVSFQYEITPTEEFYEALKHAGLAEGEYPETHILFPHLGDSATIADIINSLGCGEIIPTSSGQTIDAEKLNKFNEVLFAFDGSDIFTICVFVCDVHGDFYFDYHFYANAAELIQFPESMELNIDDITI